MHTPDLFVIGAGSGGLAAAKRAASYGARVVIAESGLVGGTCVIRGCVPKKLMVNAALLADGFADARGYGFTVPDIPLDFATLAARRNAEVARLNAFHITLLEKAGVTLVRGHARLLDARTVAVGDALYQPGKILIATGGHPVKPDIPGAELGLTSDDIWQLTTRPERLIVVGAGYIGVEFAGIFAALGSRVDCVYRHDLPLRGFDREVAGHLVTEMAVRGITCHPGRHPRTLTQAADGLCLKLDDGTRLMADTVVFATGRRPNTQGLGLEAAGIELTPHGTLRVDAALATSVPHIFAVGDVANTHPLTPIAIRDGRIFADTQFGRRPRAPSYDAVATAVFSLPPIGTVGLTEEAATATYGDDLRIYRTRFRPMVHTLSGREERVFMKVICQGTTDRVLGMHMLGRDAAEIIQGFALAVTHGLTKAQLDATLAIHPTSAEEFVTLI
jgi:glutathione reductase (NADPH)